MPFRSCSAWFTIITFRVWRILKKFSLICKIAEAATRGVLQKKVFLKILQNLQEKTCARHSFNKVTPPNYCFWICSIFLINTFWRLIQQVNTCFNMRWPRTSVNFSESNNPWIHLIKFLENPNKGITSSYKSIYDCRDKICKSLRRVIVII